MSSPGIGGGLLDSFLDGALEGRFRFLDDFNSSSDSSSGTTKSSVSAMGQLNR